MPSNADNGSLMIMTWVKAACAVMILGTVCYCTIMRIPIEGAMEKLILAILAGKELYSAKVYYESERNSRALKGRG